jgi:hypothetical protein
LHHGIIVGSVHNHHLALPQARKVRAPAHALRSVWLAPILATWTNSLAGAGRLSLCIRGRQGAHGGRFELAHERMISSALDGRVPSSSQVTLILKFATRSEHLLVLALRHSLVIKFLVCRIDSIPELRTAAVHDYVYKYVFAGKATSKETSAGRFRELDPIARSLITHYRLDSIHDIGVSSGVTSLALYRTLAATGMPVSFHISDKYAVYGRAGRWLVRIIDADGSVGELYICGILGKHADVSSKYPVTRLLYSALAERPFSDPISWFALFDREVLQYVRQGLIRRIDYDVFVTRMPDAFSFVRCMNLLNLSYFPRRSLQAALRNVSESLKEGGVLQIGRTHEDGASHAGFYRKRGARLELLREAGTGTELHEMIEQLPR